MFNKELFTKICNVECSFEELENFVAANNREYDLDNPFDKYYDVDKIILAIEKFQIGQVDERYLTYWACGYMWIVMAEYDADDTKNVSLKKVICWILEEWLDSLSFYKTEDAEYFDLDGFKTDFKLLDKLIKDNDKGLCKAIFAPHSCNDGEAVVLISNDTDKYFQKLGSYIYADRNVADIEKRSYSTLCKHITKLRKQGYVELSKEQCCG